MNLTMMQNVQFITSVYIAPTKPFILLAFNLVLVANIDFRIIKPLLIVCFRL